MEAAMSEGLIGKAAQDWPWGDWTGATIDRVLVLLRSDETVEAVTLAIFRIERSLNLGFYEYQREALARAVLRVLAGDPTEGAAS
jgi:hypothetical protein